MPILLSVNRIEAAFDRIISRAQPGEIVYLAKIPKKTDPMDLDHKASLNGVVYRHPKSGFFENGGRIHSSTEAFKDWFPSGRGAILGLREKSIVRLHSKTKESVVLEDKWKEVVFHAFTETLLVRKSDDSYVSIRPERNLFAQVVEKIGSTLWHMSMQHETPIRRIGVLKFKLGHPEGPVVIIGQEAILLAEAGEWVIHAIATKQREPNCVCKEGFIDMSTDGFLAFNEEAARPFYSGPVDLVLCTKRGAIVVAKERLYAPYESEPFGELPQGVLGYSLEPHPYGGMFFHKGYVALIVATQPAIKAKKKRKEAKQ
jgi:hypothetical protein